MIYGKIVAEKLKIYPNITSILTSFACHYIRLGDCYISVGVQSKIKQPLITGQNSDGIFE